MLVKESRPFTIELSDIIPSELNFYSRDEETWSKNVESLMESIKDIGLISPIIVRKTAGGDYEIMSGHSRYEAVCRLWEQGIGDGTILAMMYEGEYDSDMQELDYIVQSNLQRTKSQDQIKSEIKYWCKKYDDGHETGVKRDAWVGKKMGFSEKKTQLLRKKFGLNRFGDDVEVEDQPTERELTIDDLKKALNRNGKALEKSRDMAVAVAPEVADRIQDLAEMLQQIIAQID